MNSPAPQEKRSFYCFIFLGFLTVSFFAVENSSNFILGILTMLWGLLGFYRYLYLSHVGGRILPKILTLPSRILFGLNQQKDKQINLIFIRFLKPDILFWLGLGFSFIVWMLYCSFYPAEISIIQSFFEDNKKILDKIDKENLSNSMFLKNLAFYFMMVLISFMSMSYSQNSFFSKPLKYIFLPPVTLISLYVVFFLPMGAVTLYVDFSYLKGIGWGQFRLFEALVQNQFQSADSGFVRRYIEGGLVGAYGFYIVFLPPLFALVGQICKKPRDMNHWLAVLALIFLFLLDILWVSYPVIGSLQVLLLAFTAYFWGCCQGVSSKA